MFCEFVCIGGAFLILVLGRTTVCVEGLSTIRYRARVAYDGSGFAGFQLQASGRRTVQGVLEEVLLRRFGKTKEGEDLIRIVAAGRTDAGVHARGQAVHFDLDQNLNSPTQWKELEVAMNKMLPRDVQVYNIQKAPPPLWRVIDGKKCFVNWNVIYDNTMKLYSYRLSLGPCMDPMDRHYRWHPFDHLSARVNPNYLEQLLKAYEGKHDFRTFASGIDRLEKLSCSDCDTVRTVYSVKLVKEETTDNEEKNTIDKRYYRVDILLKGALYKQVRNMVGTALDVCVGRTTEEVFFRLIADSTLTRKDNPSKPAPPQGLTLEHVFFDNDPDF